MDMTLLTILEDGCNLGEDGPSEPSNKSNTIPTDLPEDPFQEEGGRSSVATTLTDQGTTTMLKKFVTTLVVESVSTPSQDADVWATKGPITSEEDINDDVFEILESVAESVETSASDDSAFDHGYDTDGDIGPFYESIEHEEGMGVEIEEDPMPSSK
eukprot:11404726-Ditylum_brightwellii.AAC.3